MSTTPLWCDPKTGRLDRQRVINRIHRQFIVRRRGPGVLNIPMLGRSPRFVVPGKTDCCCAVGCLIPLSERPMFADCDGGVKKNRELFSHLIGANEDDFRFVHSLQMAHDMSVVDGKFLTAFSRRMSSLCKKNGLTWPAKPVRVRRSRQSS